jgi:hypothetical protein
MARPSQNKPPRISCVKSSIRPLLFSIGIVAVTPRLPGDVTPVSCLGEAPNQTT